MTPAFNSAAPYSPDGTNTLAGLHSAGFVNTFGLYTSSKILSKLSNAMNSILLHIHGSIDGNLYNLCQSHQPAILYHILESDHCILALGRRILETRCWR
jgi:hypothetical protein